MLISVNWLKWLIDCELTANEIAQILTNIGLETGSIHEISWSSTKVVVGEILNAAPHPNADRLQICTVKVSPDDLESPLQIVCGAPNARTGLKVAVALVGAKLPEFTIKPAKLRGVESFGMLCSGAELNLSSDWQPETMHGILELNSNAPIGTPLEQYLNLPDTVLDIELTPNRGDCLSVVGVARELVAAGVAKWKPSNDALNQVALPTEKLDVKVLANDLAPNYYLAELINVDNTLKTPTWLKERLIASHIRPISLVVDITNFVMLEMGQPLHAFDADKVTGSIKVRQSTANETITLLNQQLINLIPGTLVIADSKQPLAIAGLMGGQASAIGLDTKRIYLESAYFKREQLSLESQQYNLTTDASYRFERGVDYNLAEAALKRAVQLLQELAGAKCVKAINLKNSAALPRCETITLTAQQLNDVLGTADITIATAASVLERLGLEVKLHKDTLSAVPPSHRFDLSLPEDLIEEAARMIGYDKLPITPINFTPGGETSATIKYQDQLADELVARGYLEAISYSFVDATWQPESPNSVILDNPIYKEGSVMRRYLWASLLPAVNYNFQRGNFNLKLFEIGKVFLRDKETQTPLNIAQPVHIAGILTGTLAPKQWGQSDHKIDFYDLKADLAALFSKFALKYLPSNDDIASFLHPARSAIITLNDSQVGFIGQLHPTWQAKWQLKQPVWLWEVDLTTVPAEPKPRYQEIAKFPKIMRDLALLVPNEVTWDVIEDTILKSAAAAPLISLQPFDLYRGKELPERYYSLAVRLIFRSNSETLTDEAVNGWIQNILAALAKIDLKLRQS